MVLNKKLLTIFIQFGCFDHFLRVLEIVKLVRFLRVMLVVFGMSGTLLVVFIACNVLLDCLLMVDIKMFPSLLVKKWENICFCRILMHIFAW